MGTCARGKEHEMSTHETLPLNLAAKPLEYWEVTYAVGILNRAWNHLWLDSEDSRGLGLELIVLAEAMRAVRTEVQ